MSKFSLEIDTIGRTGYIVVNDHDCASTRALSPSINLDLDSDGQLCGIEFLTLAALDEISVKDIASLITDADFAEVRALLEQSRLEQAQ